MDQPPPPQQPCPPLQPPPPKQPLPAPSIFQLGSLSLLSSLHLAISTLQSTPCHLHIALHLAKHPRLQRSQSETGGGTNKYAGPWHSSLVAITFNYSLNVSEIEIYLLQLEELISWQPDRSVKSYQLCGTEIRWRIEQLSIWVTRMDGESLFCSVDILQYIKVHSAI